MTNPVIDVFGNKKWYKNGRLHREDGPATVHCNGVKEWWQIGKYLDTYRPNFGCFNPKTREEALTRLNYRPRPYSYELYLVDINKLFPEISK